MSIFPPNLGDGDYVECYVCHLAVNTDALLASLEQAVADQIDPRHLPADNEPPRHLLCKPSAHG